MLNIIASRLFISEVALFIYVYDYFYPYNFKSNRSRFDPNPYFFDNVLNLPLELGLNAVIEFAIVYEAFFNEFFLIKDGLLSVALAAKF